MSSLKNGGIPEHARTNFQLLRIPPAGKIRFRSLTSAWIAAETHWNGKGTDLCTETLKCHACLAGIRKVWKGYLLGESTTSKAIKIVEITALAAFQLLEFEWRKKSLLGAVITVNRKGEKRNGPCTAAIEGWQEVLNPITMEILEHCVSTIYRVHTVQLREKIVKSCQAED